MFNKTMLVGVDVRASAGVVAVDAVGLMSYKHGVGYHKSRLSKEPLSAQLRVWLE